MRIRFVSYNVHGCVGWDGRFDPHRVASVLARFDADVVALQEVPSLERGGQAFLDEVSCATGLRAIVGAELLCGFAHHGNALLTRYPSRRQSTHELGVGTREPRGAIAADVECGSMVLHVVATHLGLLPSERREQTRRILQLVANRRCPVVLLGDFNEWFVWGRPLRWLHAHFGRPPAPRTFPSAWPTFRLDRVWVSRPSTLVSVCAHATGLARYASDHLPVVALADLRHEHHPECDSDSSARARRHEIEA